jgi:hypothetical protein
MRRARCWSREGWIKCVAYGDVPGESAQVNGRTLGEWCRDPILRGGRVAAMDTSNFGFTGQALDGTRKAVS